MLMNRGFPQYWFSMDRRLVAGRPDGSRLFGSKDETGIPHAMVYPMATGW